MEGKVEGYRGAITSLQEVVKAYQGCRPLPADALKGQPLIVLWRAKRWPRELRG